MCVCVCVCVCVSDRQIESGRVRAGSLTLQMNSVVDVCVSCFFRMVPCVGRRVCLRRFMALLTLSMMCIFLNVIVFFLCLRASRHDGHLKKSAMTAYLDNVHRHYSFFDVQSKTNQSHI